MAPEINSRLGNLRMNFAVSSLLFLISTLCFADGQFIEEYRIKIINSQKGPISVSFDQGKTFEEIGQVLLPTSKINDNGFTASKWAGTYEVSATSVNAIHIKLKTPKTIFSILPSEFIADIKTFKSYLNPNASIYTSLHAGTSIFGGGLAPFVGDKVLINSASQEAAIKEGNEIVIIVERPARWPEAIIFENKVSGEITAVYPGGAVDAIGKVIRPVWGIGRFEGSRFLDPGRIRANHPGVIDVSDSIPGMLGGFQIIPYAHSLSPEMGYSRTKTQWMIVSYNEGTTEGFSPLFKNFIRPQYNPKDLAAGDWREKILKRFLVQVKYLNKDGWFPMPIYSILPGEDLPESANNFLANVEKIRILFPKIN